MKKIVLFLIIFILFVLSQNNKLLPAARLGAGSMNGLRPKKNKSATRLLRNLFYKPEPEEFEDGDRNSIFLLEDDKKLDPKVITKAIEKDADVNINVRVEGENIPLLTRAVILYTKNFLPFEIIELLLK